MASANFAVSLDFAGLNVALPDIGIDLGASTAGLQWITVAYLLTLTIFLVPAGRVADILGRRRLCSAGLVVFTIGSVVSAVSGSPAQLAVARGITGIGAAVLIATTLSLVGTAFPEPKSRGRAIGLWTAIGAIGSASGPLFAGVLTSVLSWRWFLALAIPFALVTLAIIARGHVPESRDEDAPSRIDWLGIILLTLGMGGVVLALLAGPTRGATNPLVVGAMIVGVISLVAFSMHEHRTHDPLVEIHQFHNPGFVVSSVVAFIANIAFAAVMFFMALYMQDVVGLSAAESGAMFLALTASLIVLSPVAGRACPRIGVALVMGLGMLALTASFAALAFLDEGAALGLLVLGLVLSGAGQAFAFDGSNLGAINSVSIHSIGAASGLINAVRQAGGLLGLAFTGAMFREIAGNEPTSSQFIDGLRPTMAFVAVLCALGAIVALHGHARVDTLTPSEAAA
jgi:EmrB/QacA subfamily drug resistance transporter